jgi:hypothetical protein
MCPFPCQFGLSCSGPCLPPVKRVIGHRGRRAANRPTTASGQRPLRPALPSTHRRCPHPTIAPRLPRSTRPFAPPSGSGIAPHAPGHQAFVLTTPNCLSYYPSCLTCRAVCQPTAITTPVFNIPPFPLIGRVSDKASSTQCARNRLKSSALPALGPCPPHLGLAPPPHTCLVSVPLPLATKSVSAIAATLPSIPCFPGAW